MAELAPGDVEHLREALLAEGKLGRQVIARTMGTLAQALEWGVKRGLLPRNPADPGLVFRPSGKRRKFVPVDPALATQILRAASEEHRFGAEAALALGAGLRREEVLGLRREDLDLEAGVVQIRQALTRTTGKLHLGPPKSQKSEREVPLVEFVVGALRSHLAHQAERRIALGGAWVETDLVFDRGDGQPCNPSTFSSAWRAWAKRHGFEEVTFHTLRHGCATLLRAAGVDPVAIADILGHSDPRFTERLYTDLWLGVKREGVEKLQALLNGEL
jgi:integrase